ncbi:hypothetical protein FA95DRAFT_1614147 [Auriscalpium vulgare]|uniref:Uncharacterized protein n=1 Tax=Auriscalpium vulgare TaxID=40419 RepID=A0ACB8R0T6_9AGAM|nr:hypothetical protein FA95DRAFT_1614147 [Auriscalpium vulgare]
MSPQTVETAGQATEPAPPGATFAAPSNANGSIAGIPPSEAEEAPAGMQAAPAGAEDRLHIDAAPDGDAFYAITNGREIGVIPGPWSNPAIRHSVINYRNAHFCAFRTLLDAADWYVLHMNDFPAGVAAETEAHTRDIEAAPDGDGFYAVANGRDDGVLRGPWTNPAIRSSVLSYPNAYFRGFRQLDHANKWYELHMNDFDV